MCFVIRSLLIVFLEQKINDILERLESEKFITTHGTLNNLFIILKSVYVLTISLFL